MSAARRGFTLLELLIVIVITMSITAVAIPLLAPTRENRRVAETARIVTGMFSQARARAIETGRPVGVTLERPNNTDTAVTTLSFAEVPPPYSGGLLSTRIFIGGENLTNDVNGDGSYDAADGDTYTDWDGNGYWTPTGFVVGIGTPDYSSGSLSIVPDTSWMGLIKPGDTLTIDFHGNEYILNAVNSASVDTTTGTFNALDGTTNPWQLSSYTARFPPRTRSYGAQFQIVRQPQPGSSAIQPQTLPEGMAVDLTACASSDQVQWTSISGSITILISPTGAVQSIRWSTGSYLAQTAPVLLLLGQRALVGGNIAPKPGEPTYNWQDLDARWILINHQTGLVASNPTATVDVSTSTDVQIAASRIIAREGIKKGDR